MKQQVLPFLMARAGPPNLDRCHRFLPRCGVSHKNAGAEIFLDWLCLEMELKEPGCVLATIVACQSGLTTPVPGHLAATHLGRRPVNAAPFLVGWPTLPSPTRLEIRRRFLAAWRISCRYLSSVMFGWKQEVALVDEFQVLSIIATAIRSCRSDKQNLEEAMHEAKAVLLELSNAGLTIVPASKD
jgi:hypothetical protein